MIDYTMVRLKIKEYWALINEKIPEQYRTINVWFVPLAFILGAIIF